MTHFPYYLSKSFVNLTPWFSISYVYRLYTQQFVGNPIVWCECYTERMVDWMKVAIAANIIYLEQQQKNYIEYCATYNKEKCAMENMASSWQWVKFKPNPWCQLDLWIDTIKWMFFIVEKKTYETTTIKPI